MGLSLQHLLRYAEKREEEYYWGRIMGASLPTRIKARFNAMETSQFTFSFNQKFKVMPSARKVILTVIWESERVMLAHFQKRGENVSSTCYCEVLLKFRYSITRKRPG
jgi:hypothetical protein